MQAKLAIFTRPQNLIIDCVKTQWKFSQGWTPSMLNLFSYILNVLPACSLCPQVYDPIALKL